MEGEHEITERPTIDVSDFEEKRPRLKFHNIQDGAPSFFKADTDFMPITKIVPTVTIIRLKMKKHTNLDGSYRRNSYNGKMVVPERSGSKISQ
jgi:hypothetical protein